MADDEIDEELAHLAAESMHLADEINEMIGGKRSTGVVVGAIAQIMASYFSHYRGEKRLERMQVFGDAIEKLLLGHDMTRHGPRFVAGEDFQVVLGPQAEEKMAESPEIAEFIRDMNARIRQSLDGVDVNDPEEVDRRMRAMGATFIEADDENLPDEVRAAIAAAKRKPS